MAALNRLPFGKHVDVWPGNTVGSGPPSLSGRLDPTSKAIIDELVRQSDQEGEWTPEPRFSVTNTGVTYTSEGYYLRKGLAVFLALDLSFTALGSANGSLIIRGFPFRLLTTTPLANKTIAASPVYMFNAAGLTSTPYAAMSTGTFQDSISLYQTGATGAALIDHTNLAATTDIGLGIWFMTSDK